MTIINKYSTTITTVTVFLDDSEEGGLAVFKANAPWFILALISAASVIIIIVSIVCYRKRKYAKDQRQESVNNPMYGMSEYYGYDMESRIEETNPDYDAYYKDDSNITDDNEMYGSNEK